MATERVERRLAAILAVDVAGYSRLMGADEEGTLARLKAIRRELADPKIKEHRGRIVKTTGDGLLLEFASVVDAVRCAVEVQREMAGRNTDVPSDRAGREAKGYKRLPPERRAKVIEARRANPDAPQEHDCAVGWCQPVHSLADRTRSS
jgi:class 3 adenylate cyclase